MTHPPEWHERRRAGLGGSEVPQVVTDRHGVPLTPWADPFRLWAVKTGLLQPEEPSDAMLTGEVLELPIARSYAARVGQDLIEEPPPIAGPEPWILGSVDPRPPGWLLEIKASANRAAWGPPADEFDGDAACIPRGYRAQIEWYAFASGADRVDLAVLLMDTPMQRELGAAFRRGLLPPPTVDEWLYLGLAELRVYSCRPDAEIQRRLVRAARRWWQTHMIDGVPPARRSLRDVGALHPEVRAPRRQATPEEAALLREALDAKADEDEAAARGAALRVQIADAIGDAAGLDSDDGSATFGTTSGRVDWKAVAHALAARLRTPDAPDPLAELLPSHTGAASRTLRLNNKGQTT